MLGISRFHAKEGENISPNAADDVNLYCADRNVTVAANHLQNALDNVVQWCRKWQVELNAGESQVELFTKCPTHKKLYPPEMRQLI